jgi:hypothetical protein
MIPTIKDATDMVDVFLYNLGLSSKEPKFAKFNCAEKMDLGIHVGHAGDGALRIPAVVQQLHSAAFSKVGF